MASDQAETYLRLMAETELRHALAQPKVHQPRRRDALIRFGARRLGVRRRRRGMVYRLTTTVSARMRPVRARWYARRTIRSWRHQSTGGAYDGLRKLVAAASALVAVDALDEDVAAKIVADQQLGLELRERISTGWTEMWASPARRSGPPSGPFGVVSIGARTPLEGKDAEINVLALILGPDRAVLTVAARQPDHPNDEDIWFRSLQAAKIVDNQGGSYRILFSGGASDVEWVGQIGLGPVPRTGLHWLEVTFQPGTPPIRIDLTQVRSQESVAIEPLPEDGLAERYLDTVAEQVFAHGAWSGPRLADVTTLLGAGVVTPGNPAITRLVTLSRRLDVDVPPSLAGVPDGEFPGRWLSVLESMGAEDGPSGVSGTAAVLPELDGHRWAIAGLRSNSCSAELHVLGWGAQRPIWRRHEGVGSRFNWWVRDSAGRWHVASMGCGSWGDDRADVVLRLAPALHPKATSIDVILTGKSGRVTVTLPLEWAVS
jgi:hypothetical protein